ncbi:hypothetical protein [Klebsiella michiganensis]|uniref:hypothetical protein n=1 Tax=Klebsiella michiganensis TaxID=1134687 RepID=UPI00292FB9A4|nr:hypothetical protein [Klebsiella michiganensis]
MYFDSDTKLVISGVVILLAGLLFSILFIMIFLILLVVGLVLYLGRPPVIFYYVFLVFIICIAGSFSAKIKLKNTSQEFKCLLCKNVVNYKTISAHIVALT